MDSYCTLSYAFLLVAVLVLTFMFVTDYLDLNSPYRSSLDIARNSEDNSAVWTTYGYVLLLAIPIAYAATVSARHLYAAYNERQQKESFGYY